MPFKQWWGFSLENTFTKGRLQGIASKLHNAYLHGQQCCKTVHHRVLNTSGIQALHGHQFRRITMLNEGIGQA
jgi:hypothetical protein